MNLSMKKRLYYVFLLYPDKKVCVFFFFPLSYWEYFSSNSCQVVGHILDVSYWVKYVNFKRGVDCR